MEEAEAAAVGRLHAAAQIVPALDLVHGLVADDPLQHVGWARPVDRPQDEKAAVEPRAEQMREVVVDLAQLRFLAAVLDEVLTHRHQRRGAARGEIEPPEQLLAGRLDRLQQRLQIPGRRVLLVGFPGLPDARQIRIKAAGEQAEELDPSRHGRGDIEVEHLLGQRHARRLTAARDQGTAEALQGFRLLGPTAPIPRRARRRAIDQGTAALGDAAQQFLEEARVHRNTSASALVRARRTAATRRPEPRA